MAVQLSGRMMVVLLGGMLTVWLVSYSPLLARLWPILRGTCEPVPGPESRWADIWGMGWMRFHNQLVREVQRADEGKVPGSGSFHAIFLQFLLSWLRWVPACVDAVSGACMQVAQGRWSGRLASLRRLRTCMQGYELIFYGDSISEDWRGTSGGFPWPIGAGTSAVFQKFFSQYRAEVLAIAGVLPLSLLLPKATCPCTSLAEDYGL
jgi:hypothetical protein